MVKVYSRHKIYWFKNREEAAPIMRADPAAKILEYKVYWHAMRGQWEVTS